MRRFLVAVALVAVAAVAIDGLGDLFQSRTDEVIPGSRSEVVLELRARGYKHSLDDAAQHLVAACAGTMTNQVVASRSTERVERMAGGLYRFAVEPSLGRHNRVKLVGCLQDLTVDRLQADVVSVDRVA